MMLARNRPKPETLWLAVAGGGAHGFFTAGVKSFLRMQFHYIGHPMNIPNWISYGGPWYPTVVWGRLGGTR